MGGREKECHHGETLKTPKFEVVGFLSSHPKRSLGKEKYLQQFYQN